MGIDDVLHLIGETFARAEWVAFFLGLSGLYCALLARSGLQLGHTCGFGWRAEEIRGEVARPAGYVWGAMALTLVVGAVVVWVVKA